MCLQHENYDCNKNLVLADFIDAPNLLLAVWRHLEILNKVLSGNSSFTETSPDGLPSLQRLCLSFKLCVYKMQASEQGWKQWLHFWAWWFSKFRTRPIILILLMNSILSRVMLFPYYLPNIHIKPLDNGISNLIWATHSSHAILLLYL